MILRPKYRNQFLFLVHKTKHDSSSHAKKIISYLMMAIDKQNNRHTISPQTHIVFIMPRSKKGLGRCHESGTGNNQGRRRTTPCDNWGLNCNDCHSKSNDMSLPVISVSLLLTNLVINPPNLSSVCQQSSRSPHNSPRDNKWLDSNHINSKSIAPILLDDHVLTINKGQCSLS